MLPDIDFIDVTARNETMNTVPGAPVQVQLGMVPCYSLTVPSICDFMEPWFETETHTRITGRVQKRS